MASNIQVLQRLQQPSLGSLLGGGLGAGISESVTRTLENRLKQSMQQQEAQKQQEATNALARTIGLSPEHVQGVRPQDLSQLIRSQAEEKKALAKSESVQAREREKVAAQRSGKVLERADTLREALPAKQNALRFMKDAIEEGDLGFFSPNNMAELTGIEAFRTAKGAQLITAGKEFFLNSIQRAGARPNIFVEKQIAKMMPLIGRNKAANLTASALLGADLAVEQERVRITDELEQRFLDEKGFVPPNLGALVTKELKPRAEEIQRNLANELKEIQKTEGKKAPEVKNIRIQLPDGRTGLVPQNRLKEFLERGATRL